MYDLKHPKADWYQRYERILEEYCTTKRHIIILTPVSRKLIARKALELIPSELRVLTENARLSAFLRKHFTDREISENRRELGLAESLGFKRLHTDVVECRLIMDQHWQSLAVYIFEAQRDNYKTVTVTTDKNFYDFGKRVYNGLQRKLGIEPKAVNHMLERHYKKTVGISIGLTPLLQPYVKDIVELEVDKNGNTYVMPICYYNHRWKQYRRGE